MTVGSVSTGHSGTVAVVTGAASGIGLATASMLSEQGARVIAVDIDEAALHRNCRHLSELRIVHDMAADPDDLASAIAAFGTTPQILVNSVGIASNRRFLDLDDRRIEQVWRTNVLGPLSLTRSIARSMIDEGLHGSMVFVSSLHSSSIRRSLDYSTSKAAIVMAMRELAHELGPHRIRVNAVSPGDVHSDPIRNPLSDHNRSFREEVIPLDRLGSASDIARAILFLTNEESAAYITGADLIVDGGLSTTNWIATRSLRWRASTTSTGATGSPIPFPGAGEHEPRTSAEGLGARLISRLRGDPS